MTEADGITAGTGTAGRGSALPLPSQLRTRKSEDYGYADGDQNTTSNITDVSQWKWEREASGRRNRLHVGADGGAADPRPGPTSGGARRRDRPLVPRRAQGDQQINKLLNVVVVVVVYAVEILFGRVEGIGWSIKTRVL